MMSTTDNEGTDDGHAHANRPIDENAHTEALRKPKRIDMAIFLPTLQKMWDDGMTDYVSHVNKMRVKEIVQKHTELTEEQVKNWIRNKRRARKHTENPNLKPKATKVSLGFRAKSSWNIFLSDFCSRDDQRNLTMAERNRNAGEAYQKLTEAEMADCKTKAKETQTRSDSDLSLVQQKALSRKLLQEINKMCQRISALGHEVGVIDIDKENATMAMTGSNAICSFFDQNQHVEWKIMNVVIKSGNPNEEDRHRSLRQKVQDLFNQKYSAAVGGKQSFPYSKLDRGLILASGFPEGIYLKRPSHYGKEKLEHILASSSTISFVVLSALEGSSQEQHPTQITPRPLLIPEPTPTSAINLPDNSTASHTHPDVPTQSLASTPPETPSTPSAINESNTSDTPQTETTHIPQPRANSTPTYTTLTNLQLVDQTEKIEAPAQKTVINKEEGKDSQNKRKRKRETEKAKQIRETNATTVSDALFQVEKIIKKKRVSGKTLYFIKWKGYRPEENTWEPEEHLVTEGAKRLLKVFKENSG